MRLFATLLTVMPLTWTAIVVVTLILIPSPFSRYTWAVLILSLSFDWAAIASIWLYSENSSYITNGWVNSSSLFHSPSLVGNRKDMQMVSIKEWFLGWVGLRSKDIIRNYNILILDLSLFLMSTIPLLSLSISTSPPPLL